MINSSNGSCVGVLNVSAQLDNRIFDMEAFFTPSAAMSPSQSSQSSVSTSAANPLRLQQQQQAQSCHGRYVQFGAQGSLCSAETAKSITERGGQIYWLNKDLRHPNLESQAVAQFTRALRNLDACVLQDQQRKGNKL
jgi:hypothetical protein